MDAAELPQFIQRLFSTTLTPRQAKGLSLDGLYHIPGCSRNQATATRNVILCFKIRNDKEGFMRAVRGQTRYTFEEHLLSFFHDLSRQTLHWRVSVKGVTSQLRAADIPYKWGNLRAFIINKDGHQHRLTSPSEASTFLQALKLTSTTSATTKLGHRWDVANVAVFTPLGSSAPGRLDITVVIV
ncbi:Hypothetical predicted protein [Pelobates cultripes]|uniref:Uncharacterized protein n=1 Tax=Pelobates cultripes TaxID=61616 RepID=A0AAD1QZC1_PELCU|nr:Hypothetical predicted protein [Pelobates cultripes]